MPAEPRYCAAPASALVQVELDGLTALFDRRSGQTHLLAAPLPDLLAALGVDSWRLADFTAHLAAAFDLVADDSDPEVIVAARLDELIALGLVVAA
jgi:PqqD family protein of HPr-rel-A system